MNKYQVMYIAELVDVDQEVEESQLASVAYREFLKYTETNPTETDFTIKGVCEYLDVARFRLVLPENKKKNKREFRSAFDDDDLDDQTSRGWAEPNIFKDGSKISLRVVSDPQKRLKHFRTNNFESLFRHEYQHHLDIVNNHWSRKSRVNPNKNFDGYVNSEIEYRAFFKQQAEILLKWLRAAKNGEDTSELEQIEPDFQDFMRNGQHFRWTLHTEVPQKKFSKKMKLKYLKDMATIHKAVVTIDGATGAFKPKLIGKIVFWIGRQLNIKI